MAITYDDFAKIELRIATIRSSAAAGDSGRERLVSVDLGAEKRETRVDLGACLSEDPVGRQFMAVANLKRGGEAVAASPAPADGVQPPARTWVTDEEIAKVELRVARVLECIVHPNADKLLVLQIDLGTEKRQVCAGLRAFYQPEQLVGRSVVAVANLAPRQMRGQASEGMLLATTDQASGRVLLVAASKPMPLGTPVVHRDLFFVAAGEGGDCALISPIEPVAAGSIVK